jgi:hypothetical protein
MRMAWRETVTPFPQLLSAKLRNVRASFDSYGSAQCHRTIPLIDGAETE